MITINTIEGNFAPAPISRTLPLLPFWILTITLFCRVGYCTCSNHLIRATLLLRIGLIWQLRRNYDDNYLKTPDLLSPKISDLFLKVSEGILFMCSLGYRESGMKKKFILAPYWNIDESKNKTIQQQQQNTVDNSKSFLYSA